MPRKKSHGGLTLKFLGGTQTVTGSKFLISNGDGRWMIDCGLFQGLKEHRLRNWITLPIEAKEISSVILTHAHIDHTGYLPVFVKNGFKGKILSSGATIELCKILLPDAGHLQEEDAKFANKKGFSKHKPAMPLYTYQDAVNTFPFFEAVGDHQPADIGNGLTLTTHRAGHILGSRFLKLSTKGAGKVSILFAGDIGRYDALMVREPETITDADYLVLESTYGDHLHPDENIFDRFEKIVTEAYKRGGKVLIPSFAVGRTQEILYILKRLFDDGRIPEDLDVYLNSPLAIDATEIYQKFDDDRKVFRASIGPNPFTFPNLNFIQSESASKNLNTLQGPAVIIAGSGMMTGGRILHHLKTYAGDERSTLVIVGFQAAGTRGRSILDGAKSIKIHGQDYAIKCNMEFIESLSAHGDYGDIMKWLKLFKRRPKTTFLVHGEEKSLDAMRQRISNELGWNVEIPKYLDKAELI